VIHSSLRTVDIVRAAYDHGFDRLAYATTSPEQRT